MNTIKQLILITGSHIVPTLRRGNSFGNAPALRDAGASRGGIPTPERGNDVVGGYFLRVTLFHAHS
ncbi:MAG: hypothetical protein Q8N96_00360 [Methylovulum sp.]|nr:hypothetical protein [Methylovulum sp.]